MELLRNWAGAPRGVTYVGGCGSGLVLVATTALPIAEARVRLCAASASSRSYRYRGQLNPSTCLRRLPLVFTSPVLVPSLLHTIIESCRTAQSLPKHISHTSYLSCIVYQTSRTCCAAVPWSGCMLTAPRTPHQPCLHHKPRNRPSICCH